MAIPAKRSNKDIASSLAASKLNVLGAVVATELTFAGLSRLLVEWALELLPADRCVLTVKHPSGPNLRFEGTAEDGMVTVSEKPTDGLVIAGKIGVEPGEDPAQDLSTAETVVDSETNPTGWLEASIFHASERFGEIAVSTNSRGGFAPNACPR